MKILNFTYRNLQKISTILALVSLMVFVASCASIDKGMMAISDSISSPDPVTGRRQINLESEEKEIKRAEKSTKVKLLEAVNAGKKVDENTQYFTRVMTVFEKLQNVVHRQELPWEVHVIEDERFNAFTVGGGKVFVWTGLFQPGIGVQNDDELAAVLAHEMAHVTARHASERKGKLLVSGLADKSLRDDRFEASFRTVQEDEADKYSVIYSALAGYDPTSGIKIWERAHNASGSYAGDLLYIHPLNDDRAKNLNKYAEQAKQYYLPGKVNPEHEAILKDNAVFSYKDSKGAKAGKGGGLRALLGTAANTYGEVLKTRSEEVKRKNKKIEQERIASQQLLFRNIKISGKMGGLLGYELVGTAINATDSNIKEAKVIMNYLSSQGRVLLSQDIPWKPMRPREKRNFTIPLKSIQYKSISIRSTYVHIEKVIDEGDTGKVIPPVAKTPIIIVDEVQKLSASSWKGIVLTLPYSGTLNLSVKLVSGNPLDIYLVEAGELEKFKDSKEFQHYPSFQATKVKIYRRSAPIREGVYYIIIRDTSLGLLSSSNTNLKITAKLKP